MPLYAVELVKKESRRLRASVVVSANDVQEARTRALLRSEHQDYEEIEVLENEVEITGVTKLHSSED